MCDRGVTAKLWGGEREAVSVSEARVPAAWPTTRECNSNFICAPARRELKRETRRRRRALDSDDHHPS